MRTASLLSLLLLAACGGEQAVDTGDDTNDTNDTNDTEDTGPTYFDPVAVGFEFDGAVDAEGNLIGYQADDGTGALQEIPPVMIVTFASVDYFSATTEEEQASESCVAFGLMQASKTEETIPVEAMDTSKDPNVAIWQSYEVNFSIAPGTWDTGSADDCAALIDPEVWGEGGQDLLSAFTGIRLGLGFGPVTNYLAEGWGEEAMDEYGSSMFAQYIALNDADGGWVGRDWTTGLLFQQNEDGTLATESTPDGEMLVLQDLGAAPEALPPGYIRSFAWWYADFPDLKMDDLQAGAPAPAE